MRPKLLFFLLILTCLIVGCDPMAPRPTPQIIIVTNPPTRTPIPTPTVIVPTRTPVPTSTRAATATPTTYPCQQEGGQVIRFDRNPSDVAGENLRYRVYIPPCYTESLQRFPVVYLLHGQAATESQWEDIGAVTALDQGIALGALPPMILVMPFWGVIGNTNAFPPDPSYETVVLDELMPVIEQDFCTIEGRDNRAIGGISRGGFWALSIAMRHPDLFGAAGGHSPALPNDQPDVPPLFSPLDLALNDEILPEADLRLYIDNAAADLVDAETRLLSSRLSARGIPHTIRVNPVGNHTEEYWATHVTEYLTFYGENWTRNIADLPSCLEPSP